MKQKSITKKTGIFNTCWWVPESGGCHILIFYGEEVASSKCRCLLYYPMLLIWFLKLSSNHVVIQWVFLWTATLYGYVFKFSVLMKRQSVSQLLKRFNAFCDTILFYYTKTFKVLCQFILFSEYWNRIWPKITNPW